MSKSVVRNDTLILQLFYADQTPVHEPSTSPVSTPTNLTLLSTELVSEIAADVVHPLGFNDCAEV
jgi:hypothetical protein